MTSESSNLWSDTDYTPSPIEEFEVLAKLGLPCGDVLQRLTSDFESDSPCGRHNPQSLAVNTLNLRARERSGYRADPEAGKYLYQ